MQNRLFFLSIYIFLLGACTVAPVEVPKSKIEALSELLGDIQPQAPFAERLQLSRDIFYKTKALSKDFELTSPPLWHNTLVNLGFREKGLCYHWSDALYLHLKKGVYPHYSFHLVGANIGEYWTEHNAIAIVKKGQNIEKGIVIDPWRDSGRLYFSKVKNDKKYTWSHRVDRGCCKP